MCACLAAVQEQRIASQEQGASQQTPPVMAGVQQWVQEGSKWHTAPPQRCGGTEDDSSELRRRVSELAGVTQCCTIGFSLFATHQKSV